MDRDLYKCKAITTEGTTVHGYYYALNDDDYIKMQEYSDKQDEGYKGITVEPECRSTQYLNKKARQFLPK